ncbi:MAG: hypothetical protein IJI01_13215 [Butyrivibrio sp.]|uniref:hypothetical protein n=1 Tax=Butyrivibrio sp. TaxID=28121 RepID=UPI0025B848B6|nr:hypothetical protein [Butyrivibrio sp.]MBQ6589617.1 hypothetical protein [Butyrivibrio sp.]
MIKRIDKKLALYKSDEVFPIKLCKKKSCYQYYTVNADGQRVYIKKKDRDKVRRKFQRDYLENVKKVVITQRYRLDHFLKLYDISAISNVYDNLCDARKQMVSPIIDTKESYVAKWLAEHPGNMNTFPQEGVFLTDNGDHVRSKSEKILADLFFKLRIPYVYEPRIELSNGLNVYPDFLLLNTRTRKSYYWEHLGLITDENYSSKALSKLYSYEKDGIVLGENLLLSMESLDMPLDMRQIKKKIEKYLL